MKKTAAAVLLILLLALSMGCSRASQTLADLKSDLQQEVVGDEAGPEGADGQGTEGEKNQLDVPNMNDLTIEETYEPVQTIGDSVQEVTVSLYFADKDGQHLVKTEKSIPKVEGMARATIETLLEGPSADSGLLPTVPAGTELLDINIKAEDKKCIVDFSHELISQLGQNGVSEEAVVYSVANTLCQFPSVEQVEFRVEGQTVTTLDGQSNLTEAVCANSSIIKAEESGK